MNGSEEGSSGGRRATDLQSAYEALRGQILTPGRGGHGERELALLMRQGMAAWLSAWRHCRETAGDASVGFPAVSVGGTPLPVGLRGEIVMVLTGMVLSVSRREERACP